MAEVRTCAWCETPFQPVHPDQAYCGPTHKTAARKKRQKAGRAQPEPALRVGTAPVFAAVRKILGEKYHGWNAAPARRWYQGDQSPSSVRRPRQGAVLAEARALMPARPAALALSGRAAGLLALLDSISVLYSWERCPECSHPGWAHAGHCGRHCECLMHLPGGTARTSDRLSASAPGGP